MYDIAICRGGWQQSQKILGETQQDRTSVPKPVPARRADEKILQNIPKVLLWITVLQKGLKFTNISLFGTLPVKILSMIYNWVNSS